MDKTLKKSMKIWSPRNEQTYPTLQTVTTQQNINIPYNWPAFLAVKNGYTSLYAIIRIQGHKAMHKILLLKPLYSLDS